MNIFIMVPRLPIINIDDYWKKQYTIHDKIHTRWDSIYWSNGYKDDMVLRCLPYCKSIKIEYYTLNCYLKYMQKMW